MASSQAQSKQTLDNSQASVTDAITAQSATLLKDQQAIATAQRQLESAQTSYKSTLASNAAAASPATASDIAQQQASIVSAQVAVDTAQKAVNDTVLVAPAAGTVSAVNGAVGEAVASGGDGFITLVNVSTLQVKAAFSETDAAKVQVGQPATVTFDALTDQSFTGKVARDRRGVDGHEQRRHLQRDGRTRLHFAAGEGGHDRLGRRDGRGEGQRARAAGLGPQWPWRDSNGHGAHREW